MKKVSRRMFLGQAAVGVAGTVAVAAPQVTGSPTRRRGKGRVLLIIGDAAEAMDTLYPFFRVPEDGFELIVAGPDKRRYSLVAHEQPPGWDITEESPSYHLESDIAFRDIKPDEYVGMFISGGRAPEYIRYDEDLLRVVKHFFDKKKPVGVVCHGAEIVAKADVIRGTRMATVPKCRFDIELCGATFVDEPVVQAGPMTSCRTWHDYSEFFPVFMDSLLDYVERTTG